MRKWLEKPYHSLDYMLQDRFKEKVYKITLNGGMSCPTGMVHWETVAVSSAVPEVPVTLRQILPSLFLRR